MRGMGSFEEGLGDVQVIVGIFTLDQILSDIELLEQYSYNRPFLE